MIKQNKHFTEDNAYYHIMHKKLVPHYLKTQLVGQTTYDGVMEALELNFPVVASEKEKLIERIRGNGPLEYPNDFQAISDRIQEIIQNLNILITNHKDTVLSQHDLTSSIISIYAKENMLDQATSMKDNLLTKTELHPPVEHKKLLLDTMKKRLLAVKVMTDYAAKFTPNKKSTIINNTRTNTPYKKRDEDMGIIQPTSNPHKQNRKQNGKAIHQLQENTNYYQEQQKQNNTYKSGSHSNQHTNRQDIQTPPPPYTNKKQIISNAQTTTIKNNNQTLNPYQTSNRNKQSNYPKRCTFCHKFGHYIQACFGIRDINEGKTRLPPNKCKICLNDFGNKCKAKTCHSVTSTRGGRERIMDLRCDEHHDINYLICKNPLCRQKLKQNREERLIQYNNNRTNQRNIHGTFPNTIANVTFISTPNYETNQIINNTSLTHTRRQPYYKGERFAKPQHSTYQQPIMMAEKITIKDPCNIDKDIILLYTNTHKNCQYGFPKT